MTTGSSVAYRWSWWAIAPVALACAALASPYFLTHGFVVIGLALERGFALVCHQRPERSFWIYGVPVAVCARCLGIYLGAAVGLLLRTSRRVALKLLVGALALNLIDAITEVAGMHGDWIAVRVALGLTVGAAGAVLISSSVVSYKETFSSTASPGFR
jgi:uncharacterized membrane protein